MNHLRMGGALIAGALAVWAARPAAAADTFAYDALGRLVSVVSDSGASRTYTYDAADNMVTMTVGSGGSGGGSATWDPTKADANWAFSADKLTASYDGFGSTVIGTTGYSSGEHEYSVTVHNPQTTQIGVSRLETNPAGADIGSGTDSTGMRQDGKIYGNSFTQYADLGSAPAEGDVITVHLKNNQLWFRKNGGTWNPGIANANPTTGVGGIPAPTLSGAHPNLYPMAYAGGDGPGGAAAVQYVGNFASW